MQVKTALVSLSSLSDKLIISIQQQEQRTFNGPFSGTTRASRYQKGKNNLDFTEARGSEWQWHQLGRMQVCTSLQTDNHASTLSLRFLQAGCPSCLPTNSVKALKALLTLLTLTLKFLLLAFCYSYGPAGCVVCINLQPNLHKISCDLS